MGRREALSSSQEKIQACGPWVGGVEVAQQTRGASPSKIPNKGTRGVPHGWVGCRAAPGSSSPHGVGFVHLELGLLEQEPLEKPFIHVPSQWSGNQSKNNRFVFTTPALKW